MLLGRLDNGLGYYRFTYNGSEKAYVGVIAQEVRAVRPDAVAVGRDGYLRVSYERLGLPFQSFDHWVASGAPAAEACRPDAPRSSLSITVRRKCALTRRNGSPIRCNYWSYRSTHHIRGGQEA